MYWTFEASFDFRQFRETFRSIVLAPVQRVFCKDSKSDNEDESTKPTG